MMDENKDKQLQSAFEGYFDGGEEPNVDLGRAKSELQKTRSRRKRGRMISAVLSACAAFALVLAVTFVLLPAFTPAGSGNDWAQSPPPLDVPGSDSSASPNPDADGDHSDISYSLADAEVRTMSYAELAEAFGEYALDFARLEADGTADCGYGVYTYKGRAVLLYAEITAEGDVPFTATVYADLSNGRYSSVELAPYRDLPLEEGYRVQTQIEGGVYLSKVYWEKNGETFADLQSSSELGVQTLLAYFL